MLLYDRSDGKRVRDVHAFNAIFPYVVRRRYEASVFLSRDIDVEAATSYIKSRNNAVGGERYSLFGLLIAAAVRTIALKPRLNRFVHGRAFYQRKDIAVTFIVRKALTEAAAEGSVKIRFDAEDCIPEAMSRIAEGIELKRGDVPGPDDREFDITHRIPLGKAAATGLFSLLDRFNLAPPAMIEADPLFTSIYVANLGSIGLDTPYHNLYEWGSSSLFMAVGRIFQRETHRGSGMELRHFVNLKFTVDERIAEGIYFAHSAALFQRLVAHPEALELPPDLSQAEV